MGIEIIRAWGGNLMSTLLLFASLLLLPARAGTDGSEVPILTEAEHAVIEAEHMRISEEMAQLASRQLWSGLERKYERCLKLGVDLTFEDYLHGAYSARGLGDAKGTYERLLQAAEKQSTKEVIDWLWSIDNTYGHVSLSASPARTASLSVDSIPFAPDQRAAVDFAVEAIERDGEFRGLLPKGTYSLSGVEFYVEPGISLQLDISPKQRRVIARQEGDEPTE